MRVEGRRVELGPELLEHPPASAANTRSTTQTSRSGLEQGALTYAQPTTRLAARCRGSTLAVHHRARDPLV
jgi:hypothetical protein